MANETITNIPSQKKTWNEKKANDFQWAKDCINGYINLASLSNNSYKYYLKKLYDYYNGHVYQEDYKSVLEPYGEKRLETFPAEIRNYPIIRNKIDLLRGEFAKRPDNFTVVVKNSDVFTNKTEELNQAVNQSLEQVTINTLNSLGLNTGQESQEVEQPSKVKKYYDLSWRDKRAYVGQNSLSYIKSYNKTEEIYDTSFLDWLTAGEVYSYRGVEHKEPVYENVNPLDIDFDKDPDLQFVEDGDWVVRRKYMHVSSVIDMFYDELTDTQVKDLETQSVESMQSFTPYSFMRDSEQPYKNFSRLMEVVHVTWKSRRKFGILSYQDEMGQTQQREVDESYRLDPTIGDLSIEWHWGNEAWEGYRINNKFWLRMQPIPVQRTSLDNASKCKLPYNGRIMSNRNSRNVSLVALGVPYQINYNIVKYRLELALAKMKDVIALLDINAIPKGWSVDKWLSYVDGTGVGFVDYAKEGVKLNPQHQSQLDLASKVLGSYIEILAFIDSEWSKLCGISPNREGEIQSQETVGGVERSVAQSSLITEIYFRLFDQFKQRDYEALLDYSRIAWVEGKKASYVQPDLAKILYLDVDGIQHSETEYGVFVSNALKDSQKIQQLQALASTFAQNGTPASAIAEIIDTESFVQIKAKLKEAEDNLQQFEIQKAQQEQQAAQQALEMQAQIADREHEFEAEQNQLDRENKVLVAQIGTLRGKDGATDMNNDSIPDAFELETLQSKERIEKMKASIKNKEIDAKLAHEKEMKAADIKMKEKELQSKEKIAKMKPRPVAKK